jgi:hypothetical protein
MATQLGVSGSLRRLRLCPHVQLISCRTRVLKAGWMASGSGWVSQRSMLFISSSSHAETEAMIRCFGDTIIGDEFQMFQRNFMVRYNHKFEDREGI